MEICGNNPGEMSALEQEFQNENIFGGSSRDSSSRIAIEDRANKHKISNTNPNFYNFRNE